MTSLFMAVAFVVVVSAICSLFEAVLYSIPVSHIESLSENGNPAGRILKDLRKNMERPITAILSLNTISNTAGAALAGALAAKALGEDAVIYFSVALTFLILIVSEVVPKTAGVVYAKPLAELVARPLAALTILFTPFIWLCGFATRLISRSAEPHSVSEDELRVLARIGGESGAIDPGEQLLIDNALTLDHKTVSEVMTPQSVVFVQRCSAIVDDVFRMEQLEEHSRFPVYEDDPGRPTRIVYSRAVMSAAAHDLMHLTLAEVSQPIQFVKDDETLDLTLTRFLRQGHHLMAVLGEDGGFRGVVTLEDVLEELLGREIVDETDRVEDLQALAKQRRDDLLDVSPDPRPRD